MAKPLRIRFRLMLGHSAAIGPGKADLLGAVAATGSISAAARTMGMSYKRAWYLIDAMNRCFSAPVVEAVKGGREHGGAVLTPMGEAVLASYRSMEARVGVAIAADLRAFSALLTDGIDE